MEPRAAYLRPTVLGSSHSTPPRDGTSISLLGRHLFPLSPILQVLSAGLDEALLSCLSFRVAEIRPLLGRHLDPLLYATLEVRAKLHEILCIVSPQVGNLGECAM